MNLFRKFIEEIQSVEVLECDNGFITYRINDDKSCYIGDAFTSPDFRRKGITSELVKSVEKKAITMDCKEVYCQVDKDNPNIESVLITALKLGYKIRAWDMKLIELYKEVSNV